MRFHFQTMRDPRTRFYCPVSRIIRQVGMSGAENFLGNREIQTILRCLPHHVTVPSGGSMLLDFGEALHGGIRLNLGFTGGVGMLRVKFGESVSEAIHQPDPDSSRRDAVLETPTCGMMEYGNTVFRFVQIENVGKTDVVVQNILAVALEYDLEMTGAFESSDERLNRIWKTAVRTVHLCMQDYLYDGAKRDRIVWMGDMHPEIRGIFCAFSDHSIIRKSLEFLIRQTPPDQPMNTIYTYSCWFIISAWDYYLATGDLDFLEQHRDYIKAMLDVFAGFVDENGSECVPERRFLDWPNDDNPKAKHAGIQALMLWMMTAGASIYQSLGMDPTHLLEIQRKLRRHIPDPDGRKAPAALLTLTGLANRRDVLELNPFQGVSTFYGYYMLLAKETIPALELIRRYWGAMLDLGATSFWEDFDLSWTQNAFGIDSLPIPGKKDIHADFGAYCYKGLRHSLSHGWSCGPAPFLSERVLGVKTLEPGCRKMLVKPDLGDLEYAKGAFPTPWGAINIEVERGKTAKISAPSQVDVVCE